jgi:hypothetical protein
MQYQFTMAERIVAASLVGQYKGDLAGVKAIGEDYDLLKLSAEDTAAIELETTETGSLKWSQEKAKELEARQFDLRDATVAYLVSKVDELSKDNRLSLGDGPIISLYEKLKPQESA